MDSLPTRDDFEANLNSAFVIHVSDQLAVEAKLASVTELKRSERLESFSLLFVAPRDAPNAQNLYRVDNQVLGSFDLFLVPVGMTDEGLQYEAVFNNLVSEK